MSSKTVAEQVVEAVVAQQGEEIRTPGDIAYFISEYCFEFGIDDETATEASEMLHRRMGFEIF